MPVGRSRCELRSCLDLKKCHEELNIMTVLIVFNYEVLNYQA